MSNNMMERQGALLLDYLSKLSDGTHQLHIETQSFGKAYLSPEGGIAMGLPDNRRLTIIPKLKKWGPT